MVLNPLRCLVDVWHIAVPNWLSKQGGSTLHIDVMGRRVHNLNCTLVLDYFARIHPERCIGFIEEEIKMASTTPKRLPDINVKLHGL
jgi:hypothetical protein